MISSHVSLRSYLQLIPRLEDFRITGRRATGQDGEEKEAGSVACPDQAPPAVLRPPSELEAPAS